MRKYYKRNTTTFVVLRVHTFINVFMGSILSLYQYKICTLSQILDAGPLTHFFKAGISSPPLSLTVEAVLPLHKPETEGR